MKRYAWMIAALFSVSSAWGEWHDLEMKLNESLWVSSVLSETIRGTIVSYPPENLFDSDTSTAWVEGVEGYGRGESVLILTNRIVSGISMVNGFAKSEGLYNNNSRIKELGVSFVCGLNAPGLVTENDYYLYFLKENTLEERLSVEDTREKQSFPLYDTERIQEELILEMLEDFSRDYPDLFKMILSDLGIENAEYLEAENIKLIMEIYGFIGLKLTVEDVYPGSRYEDTCISEIEIDY